MGGGLALLGPTVSDSICCVVAFYPAMPWPDYAPDWSRYAGQVGHGAQGEVRRGLGRPGDRRLRGRRSRRSGGSVEVFDYPDSVHAFFNDARPEVFQADNAEIGVAPHASTSSVPAGPDPATLEDLDAAIVACRRLPATGAVARGGRP